MDVFKAMGITVGNDIKMIDQVESKTVAKSDESVQIVRKGSDISARERLEGQLEKGFVMSRAPQYAPGHEGKTDYEGGLKNTHGENWHTDNDKVVEEFLSAAEPIDREFPAESKANTKTPRHPATYAPTGEQSHTLEFKSLSQEELFMKAFDEVDEVVVKGKKKKFDFNKDGKIDEHEEHHAEMEAEKACGVSKGGPGSGRKKNKATESLNVQSKEFKRQAARRESDPKFREHEALLEREENKRAEGAYKKSELDEIFDLVKGMPRVSSKAPHQEKDPVQVKEERQQKKQLLGKWAKKSVSEWEAAYESGSLVAVAPDPYADRPDLIATVHENSDDVTEKIRPMQLERSELDEIFDLVKGGPGSGVRGHTSGRGHGKDSYAGKVVAAGRQAMRGEEDEREWNEEKTQAGASTEYRPSQRGVNEQVHSPKEMKRRTPSSGTSYAGQHLRDGQPEIARDYHEETLGQIRAQKKPNLPKSFIKASGPGGMLFDFGATTGNPIADQATALLNAHSDPIQASNATYNATSYQKALTDFVNKGDAAYAQQTTMFGNIDKEWSNQLNKPMDQQVKEAFQKGELDNADPSAPAIKNDFNKTELNLGGQVIKATSETDAAIIEMMKAQNMSMPGDGMIADATAGGRVSITAGEPLPQV